MSISKPYTIGDTKEAKANRDATYDRVFGRKVKINDKVYRLFLDEDKIVKIGDEDGNEVKKMPRKDKEEIDRMLVDGII